MEFISGTTRVVVVEDLLEQRQQVMGQMILKVQVRLWGKEKK
jgi:hypothetical protein